uniref:HAD family phosphatase n=1 Tax=Roseihalotalea indica TaxID=2867963 RepID=A0AA49JH71_9BACT|nr:HAD family phosphatase [Tunicatimonas sp. TK19036]
MPFNTVIFDLGGVLIDWNPEYLYRKIFSDEAEMNRFLTDVCHSDWNREQDRGRLFAEAVKELVATHPSYENEIQAYHERWDEMLGGAIAENVAVLEELKKKSDINLYAITNWSAETFPIAQREYPFLQHFQDTVVSGELKVVKPDAQIYQTLLDRQPIVPEQSIFIDDVLENIEGARALGIHGIHLTPNTNLRQELEALKVLP